MHYYNPPFFAVQYYVYQLVLVPCYNLFAYILSKVLPKKEIVMDVPAPIPVVTTTSLTEQYIQRQTTRLLKTYDISPENAAYSENIDAVFYSKSQWTELLKDENNFLEKKWRTKMLIENTPRGNIIMYYDAYKLAFAYYSDQTVPYPLLNAVAMKYVLTFFCRDFFMDEIVLGNSRVSGITAKHEEDAEKARVQKEHVNKPHPENATIDNVNVKSWRFESTSNTNAKSPFAKFKSYNNVSAKSTNASSKSTAGRNIVPSLAEPKQTNRFVSLGKTRNVSLLQKPEVSTIKNVLIGNTFSYDATPSTDHSFAFEDKSSTSPPRTPLTLRPEFFADTTDSASGSLTQSGIYSIFSPTSTMALSFDGNPSTDHPDDTPAEQSNPRTPLAVEQKTQKPISTTPTTQIVTNTPNPKPKPLQKQQLTYAEYKRLQINNK